MSETSTQNPVFNNQVKDTISYNIDQEFESLKDEIQANQLTEIELQEKSLSELLKSIEKVNFLLEKEPKLNDWRKEANRLQKIVLDDKGEPINKESEDFQKFESLKAKINRVKVKRQEYSVLVIQVFKKMVLKKDLDLKVFNKEIF